MSPPHRLLGYLSTPDGKHQIGVFLKPGETSYPDETEDSSGRREFSEVGKQIVTAIAASDQPTSAKSLLAKFKDSVSRDKVYFVLEEYVNRGYLRQTEDGYLAVSGRN